MSRLAYCLAILLASLLPGLAQRISIRSGAAFVAVRSAQHTNGDLSVSTGLVARSSNGSTYEELTTNGVTLITIVDVPHQRTIILDPKRHEYQIGLSPGLRAAELVPENPENYAQMLSTRPAKITSEDGVMTQIGRKKIEGFDVFGKTFESHDGHVQETWYCPKLDLNLNTKMQTNGNGPDTETKFTQIQLAEPDPKLFEIPAGYTQQERNREMVGRVDR
jgi:hypothetical protein